MLKLRPTHYRRPVSRIALRKQSTNSKALPPSPDLSNLNCIITGGTRGIGVAIASRFLAHGASCTLLSRTSPSATVLAELQSKIDLNLSTTPPKLSHFTADVGDVSFWEDTKALGYGTDRIPLSQYHVLINAAGISQGSLLVRADHAGLQQIVQTNLMGTMWACKALAKAWMRNAASDTTKRHTRCIVNVSSLLAVQGGAGAAAYAASKAGILGLTRALTAELGPRGIRVNAVVPGYIDTEMTSSMTQSQRASIANCIPAQRFGTAEEVADAILFLVTNQYANNCVLNLDGGLSAMGGSSSAG